MKRKRKWRIRRIWRRLDKKEGDKRKEIIGIRLNKRKRKKKRGRIWRRLKEKEGKGEERENFEEIREEEALGLRGIKRIKRKHGYE